MTAFNVTQHPIRLTNAAKHEVRTQFAALPWRMEGGKVEILLVTSRGTGRWIIPKGWPMHNATPAGAAATEAYEEAGVLGTPSHLAIGFYSYRKEYDGDDMPIVVAVFPVRVKRLLESWPERHERKRKWVSRKKAAQMLMEPELGQIIRAFDPRKLRP